MMQKTNPDSLEYLHTTIVLLASIGIEESLGASSP